MASPEQFVPTSQTIVGIYGLAQESEQQTRYSTLQRQFETLFDQFPSTTARSPGRVNLIGEHIDYSLYEVLPFAIAADVVVLLCEGQKSGEGLNIYNFDDKRFPPSQAALTNGNVQIDQTTLHWSNYVKAGYQGAVDYLRDKGTEVQSYNLNVLVDGRVPVGGGLSSSAALVCASALAVLDIFGSTRILKQDLVELAIQAERLVGVNAGGMDQAASVLSARGQALSVNFLPSLQAKLICFPRLHEPFTFIIAQSFVAADKHLTATTGYNLRVVECTIAAHMLAKISGIKLQPDASPLGNSLAGFQKQFFARRGSCTMDEQLQDLLHMVETHLDNEQGYTRMEVAAALAIPSEELELKFCTKFPVQFERLMLKQRARHVFTEARRVTDFKYLLQNPPSLSDAQYLGQLGDLMNETQASCRDDFDCSCPELDRLCTIAREAGAYGSRLTGAGWGGCTIHLVPAGKIHSIRSALEEQYYRVREPDITPQRLEEGVIITAPENGAML